MILRSYNFLSLTLRFCLFFSNRIVSGIDTITSSQPLEQPNAVVSNSGVYRLSFFNLDNSTLIYAGILYNHAPNTVLWVADTNHPLQDGFGAMTISPDGNLMILTAHNVSLWSTNVTNADSGATAQLLDSGNLVLNNAAGETLWDAFSDPGNMLYSDMKLSVNRTSGERITLRSWRSESDPSVGEFICGLSPDAEVPEIFVWRSGAPYLRSGPWNRQVFTGFSAEAPAMLDGITVADDNAYAYFSYSYANRSLLSMFTLTTSGGLQQSLWRDTMTSVEVQWEYPIHACDLYDTCGAFATCSSSPSRICRCLRGFVPRDEVAWRNGNWSDGCVRKKPLKCEEDGFLKMEGMRAPDFGKWSHSSEAQCRADCLRNCSCVAYSFSSGIGCLTWNRSLVDMAQLSVNGVDLYIRLESSELAGKDFPKGRLVGIVFAAAIAALAVGVYLSISKRRRNEKARKLPFDKRNLQAMKLLDLNEVREATNGFAEGNKLGQGGFGQVFKGNFEGVKIAVKRLSKSSGQGVKEFMTEVEVMSKLQHRNLVRLFGCCVEGDERMLIYEYLENRSLDGFLFDEQKRPFLNWETRFGIINGICRGLLYLHNDSRLRIIHRDLKASNILLDEDLNPKISDFGLARIFTGKDDEASTRHVVGTYGYMSPEYAMEGIFSEKSDVFSLGVLLLEIVSGKRNSSFHANEYRNLVAYAWSVWKEGNFDELIDSAMEDREGGKNRILRCIHVGFLCVEESAIDRPLISSIIVMINNENLPLPPPKQPAFSIRNLSSFRENQSSHIVGDAFTISLVTGR